MPDASPEDPTPEMVLRGQRVALATAAFRGVWLMSSRLAQLEARKKHFWDAVAVYLEQRDAHGVMDMAVEVQATQYAINALRLAIEDAAEAK